MVATCPIEGLDGEQLAGTVRNSARLTRVRGVGGATWARVIIPTLGRDGSGHRRDDSCPQTGRGQA